jgi:LPS-assembly protein
MQFLWNDKQSRTGKASFGFRYTPDQDRMLGLAYRYEADSIEQADTTVIWPVRRRWKVVARWLYSLRDAQTLQNTEGVQYDSCCWALRLVHRRYITQIDNGSFQDNVFFQFELKGLANVGSDINRMFTEGIFN